MPARWDLQGSGLRAGDGPARVNVRVVVEEDRPRERRCGESAVLRVGRVAAERDRVAGTEESAVRGGRIVGTGGLPTVIVRVLERVELTPSETVTRAAYVPDVW